VPHGLIPPAGRAQATGAAVPARLLSETVAGASADALERAAAGPAEHTLRLTELAPSVCLPALLARWEGEYTLAAPPPAGEPGRHRGAPAEALVRFARASALVEALAVYSAARGEAGLGGAVPEAGDGDAQEAHAAEVAGDGVAADAGAGLAGVRTEGGGTGSAGAGGGDITA